jgi:hypothetical protein
MRFAGPRRPECYAVLALLDPLVAHELVQRSPGALSADQELRYVRLLAQPFVARFHELVHEGKAKTPKHKTKENSPPRIKSARKHENKPGLRSPFLLTRLVHYLAALWHILSLPLTLPARNQQEGSTPT